MRIDHVELYVPDREQAAVWYGRVLGFQVLDQHRDWAVSGGPLMVSNDGGQTMVALFEGVAQGEAPVRGWRRLALRASGADWVRFVRDSGQWRDEPLGQAHVFDHGKAVSVYFSDPWGNLLEVTSYEPAVARRALPELFS